MWTLVGNSHQGAAEPLILESGEGLRWLPSYQVLQVTLSRCPKMDTKSNREICVRIAEKCLTMDSKCEPWSSNCWQGCWLEMQNLRPHLELLNRSLGNSVLGSSVQVIFWEALDQRLQQKLPDVPRPNLAAGLSFPFLCPSPWETASLPAVIYCVDSLYLYFPSHQTVN